MEGMSIDDSHLSVVIEEVQRDWDNGSIEAAGPAELGLASRHHVGPIALRISYRPNPCGMKIASEGLDRVDSRGHCSQR